MFLQLEHKATGNQNPLENEAHAFDFNVGVCVDADGPFRRQE